MLLVVGVVGLVGLVLVLGALLRTLGVAAVVALAVALMLGVMLGRSVGDGGRGFGVDREEQASEKLKKNY